MIVVTGGAGFIGSNLVRALNAAGHQDILVVDDLQDGKKFLNLVDLDIADYMDKDAFLLHILSGRDRGDIEVIFHQGACSSTTEWNGKYMMENNYQYSKQLLDYCLGAGIPFIYASSAATYGGRSDGFTECRQNEKPLNVYGYSKFLFDEYVRRKLPQAASAVAGLRYFNVYGPREGHKGSMASVAFHLNRQITSGKNPQLFAGSENFRRDFIYVDDVAAVNLWCWRQGVSGIFNCGCGQAQSFLTLAQAVMDYHQHRDIDYIPMPEHLGDCYQTFTQADVSGLRFAGYNAPFTPLAEGINQYMAWLNHKG